MRIARAWRRSTKFARLPVARMLTTAGARVQAEALGMRSYLLLNQQRPREAVAPADRAVALLVNENGNESLPTLQAMLELARTRYHADRCEEAMPEIDRALELVPRAASPTDAPQRPHALTTLPFACRRCLRGGEPRHSRDSYSRRPFTGSSTTV